MRSESENRGAQWRASARINEQERELEVQWRERELGSVMRSEK